MDIKKLSTHGFKLTAIASFFICQLAFASPEGGSVAQGSAAISQSGNTTTIHQTSQAAVINWNSFNTASHEAVVFNQPNASAIALNRITNGLPTQFAGSLTANGQVWILNPAGVLFTSTARIDVAGLVATTHNIVDSNFMSGNYKFDVVPGYENSKIINNGLISVKDAGIVALVAPGVENNGVIIAHLGKVHLASGPAYTLDMYGDSLINFGTNAPIQNGSVSNSGLIKADGGKVYMTAHTAAQVVENVVSMSGVIEARSVSVNKKGEIVLHGGGAGKVKVTGKLVTASADNTVSGGLIETSGYDVDVTESTIETGVGGTWLLDPPDLILDSTTLPFINFIQNQLNSGTNIILLTIAATPAIYASAAYYSQYVTPYYGNIYVNSPITWTGPAKLKLSAAAEIFVNAPITNTGGGTLDLIADSEHRTGASGLPPFNVHVTANISVDAPGAVNVFHTTNDPSIATFMVGSAPYTQTVALGSSPAFLSGLFTHSYSTGGYMTVIAGHLVDVNGNPLTGLSAENITLYYDGGAYNTPTQVGSSPQVNDANGNFYFLINPDILEYSGYNTTLFSAVVQSASFTGQTVFINVLGTAINFDIRQNTVTVDAAVPLWNEFPYPFLGFGTNSVFTSQNFSSAFVDALGAPAAPALFTQSGFFFDNFDLTIDPNINFTITSNLDSLFYGSIYASGTGSISLLSRNNYFEAPNPIVYGAVIPTDYFLTTDTGDITVTVMDMYYTPAETGQIQPATFRLETEGNISMLGVIGEQVFLHEGQSYISSFKVIAGGSVTVDAPLYINSAAPGTTSIEIVNGAGFIYPPTFFQNNDLGQTFDPGAGRFLIWSVNPNAAGENRGSGLAYDFIQYNSIYGITPEPSFAMGNGFLYQPVPLIVPGNVPPTQVFSLPTGLINCTDAGCDNVILNVNMDSRGACFTNGDELRRQIKNDNLYIILPDGSKTYITNRYINDQPYRMCGCTEEDYNLYKNNPILQKDKRYDSCKFYVPLNKNRDSVSREI